MAFERFRSGRRLSAADPRRPSAARMRTGLAAVADHSAVGGGSSPQSLGRNFSWTLAGNVVYSACQWGMLMVLAKLGSPEVVGQFALGLAVTAPIMLGANLHLRTIQATDVREEYSFGTYLRLRLLGIAFGLLAVLVVTSVVGYTLVTAVVIILVAVSKAAEGLSEVLYGLFQQRERMDGVAISLVARGGAGLLGLALGMVLTGSLMMGLVGLSVGWFLVFLMHDLPRARLLLVHRSPARPVAGSLRSLFYLALPLGVVAVLASLQPNVPRYVVKEHLGTAALGIFAAMAYVLVAGNVVIQALCQSASARLARYADSAEVRQFIRLTGLLVGIAAAMGAIGILVAYLAGAPLLTLLYSEEYAANADVFVWLNVAGLAGYVGTVLWFSMVAGRRLAPQIPLHLVVIAVTLAVSLWGVPRYGLMGAVWGLLASQVVKLLIMVVILGSFVVRLSRTGKSGVPPAAPVGPVIP